MKQNKLLKNLIELFFQIASFGKCQEGFIMKNCNQFHGFNLLRYGTQDANSVNNYYLMTCLLFRCEAS